MAKVVEDHDRRPLGAQGADTVPSDEPGAAGHEDAGRQALECHCAITITGEMAARVEVMSRSARRRRALPRVLISAALSIILLTLVLRAIPVHALGQTMRHASLRLFLIAMAAALAFGLARAWRYRLLLGREHAGRAGTLTTITLASWGASLVLPGPSGDAVFVWLARTTGGTPVALGAGAAVVSRLLDIISLLLIALLTAPLAGVTLPRAVTLVGAALAILVVLLLTGLYVSRIRRRMLAAVFRIPMLDRLAPVIGPAVEHLAGQPNRFWVVLATVAARVFTAVQYMALFAAIGHSLAFVQVWFALSVRTLFFAIPLQGLGGFGTTQLWWTTALILLGWRTGAALTASLAVHLLDLSASLPIGAVAWVIVLARLLREPAASRSLPDLRSAAVSDPTPGALSDVG
jgi:hypothetical protein